MILLIGETRQTKPEMKVLNGTLQKRQGLVDEIYIVITYLPLRLEHALTRAT